MLKRIIKIIVEIIKSILKKKYFVYNKKSYQLSRHNKKKYENLKIKYK